MDMDADSEGGGKPDGQAAGYVLVGPVLGYHALCWLLIPSLGYGLGVNNCRWLAHWGR